MFNPRFVTKMQPELGAEYYPTSKRWRLYRKTWNKKRCSKQRRVYNKQLIAQELKQMQLDWYADIADLQDYYLDDRYSHDYDPNEDDLYGYELGGFDDVQSDWDMQDRYDLERLAHSTMKLDRDWRL